MKKSDEEIKNDILKNWLGKLNNKEFQLKREQPKLKSKLEEIKLKCEVLSSNEELTYFYKKEVEEMNKEKKEISYSIEENQRDIERIGLLIEELEGRLNK